MHSMFGSERLEQDWLTHRVCAAWDDARSGVRDGALRLGAHCMGVPMLVHEMGHLVEIDDRRATENDFGLRYKRVVRLPPTSYSSGIYPQPLTAQGVERECRVIAISVRILGAIGWPPEAQWADMENTIAALRHMDDWCNVPGRRSDEARSEWCRRKVSRDLVQWPLERVRAEWWRKVVLVTKRLERADRRAAP